MPELDSPQNYPCYTCLARPGEPCLTTKGGKEMDTFHAARRAYRMSAMVRRSKGIKDSDYRPGVSSAPTDERHTTTEIQRPDPTLWPTTMYGSLAYRAAVAKIVDAMVDQVAGPPSEITDDGDQPTFEDQFEVDEARLTDEHDPLLYRVEEEG